MDDLATDVTAHYGRGEDTLASILEAFDEARRLEAWAAGASDGVTDDADSILVITTFEEALARHRDRPRRWVALVDSNGVQLGNVLTLTEHHGIELTATQRSRNRSRVIRRASYERTMKLGTPRYIRHHLQL